MTALNLDHLEDLGGLSSPELVAILREFLAQLPRDADELTAALHRQDAAAVRTLAHRFKGAAGNAGFPELSALGERLERAATADTGLPPSVEVTALLQTAIGRASESFEEALRETAR